MTERINVATKTLFNRIRAVIGLVFWIVVGIIIYLWLSDRYYFDFAWVGIVGGIVIGIIRLFVINDKYAWQVATLEEIQSLKSLLSSEKEKNKIDEVGRKVDDLRFMLREIESQLSYSKKPKKVTGNTDKQEDNTDSDDASYIQTNRNGRFFAMKDGKLYCPKCHSFVDSDTQTMCSNCGYSFM